MISSSGFDAEVACCLFGQSVTSRENTRPLFNPGGIEAVARLKVSVRDDVVDTKNGNAGLGELGIGLALLQRGVDQGLWSLSPPADDELVAGAIEALASWDGASARPIFFARSAAMVIALDKNGAFANDNAIVIHADAAWHEMQEANVIESPRTICRSPGRNGTIGTQHVSLARMIACEATTGALSSRFVREVSL